MAAIGRAVTTAHLLESTRHYADDRERRIGETDVAADHMRVEVKKTLPEVMTDDYRHGRPASQLIGRSEVAAERRGDAQQPKEFVRDAHADQALGMRASVLLVLAQISGEVLKDPV